MCLCAVLYGVTYLHQLVHMQKSDFWVTRGGIPTGWPHTARSGKPDCRGPEAKPHQRDTPEVWLTRQQLSCQSRAAPLRHSILCRDSNNLSKAELHHSLPHVVMLIAQHTCHNVPSTLGGLEVCVLQ